MGKKVRKTKIDEDITERKKAEEGLERSEKEARRLAQENEVIAKIGQIISSTLKIEKVYEQFAEEVHKVISFDRISVNVIDYEKEVVTVAYAVGFSVPGRQPGDVFPLAGSTNEKISRTQSSLLIQPKNGNDMAVLLPGQLSSFQSGFRSQIAVPLISENQVIGILNFLSQKMNAYSELDLRLGESIGLQIAGVIANAQLYVKQKKSEGALRESEERYRTLVEESFDGIFVQKGSKIIFANRRLYEMLGFDKGELEGIDHWLVYHPDYQKLTRERAQARMCGEKVPSDYEVKLQRKDGSSFEGEINSRVIMFDDTSGIQVWIRDITERKQAEKVLRESEERFQIIANATNDAIWDLDLASNSV